MANENVVMNNGDLTAVGRITGAKIKAPAATDFEIGASDTLSSLLAGKVGSFSQVGGASASVSSGVADLSNFFSNTNTSLNLDNVRVSASVATSAKSYIDGIVGTINTALDTLNGEVA